jgi:hypothetical protein
MEIDIITQKDLFKFKNELLKEIQELLEGKRIKERIGNG